MKRLADQIKQALAALATADIGERSGRRAMHEALFPDRAVPPVAVMPPARKCIALGVGESLSPSVMAYALGACRRMDADLLLLTRDALHTRDLLAPYLADLEGVACQAEELPAASRRDVARVLAARSQVLFAISGGANDPVALLLKGRPGLLEARSPVPVVVVGPEPRKSLSPRRRDRLVAAH